MNFLERREAEDEFDKLLSRFVRNFAELEWYLLYLWGVVEYPSTPRRIFIDRSNTKLEERRKAVTNYVHRKVPRLRPKWDKINTEIGRLNDKRKLLVHKSGMVAFYKDFTQFLVPEKNQLEKVEVTIKEIKGLLDDFAELFTGDEGINGNFAIEFTTERYNEYNTTVDVGKIIYKVNGVIKTDFKGP